MAARARRLLGVASAAHARLVSTDGVASNKLMLASAVRAEMAARAICWRRGDSAARARLDSQVIAARATSTSVLETNARIRLLASTSSTDTNVFASQHSQVTFFSFDFSISKLVFLKCY